ncbi:MAG: EAL domain-containing protein [Betaproteobacteria bacterium]|nr:EAL domain-containing protein [Betaproteobacteria bacterium]
MTLPTDSGPAGSRGWRRLVPLRLRHPLPLVFAAIMAVVGTVIYLLMAQSQRKLIEHEAVKIAEIVAGHALAARTVYTTQVSSKLAADGTGAVQDYHGRPGYVPLPAQFLKYVGRESERRSQSLYQYRPLSKWNLEPTQGLSDDFQRWAWRGLEAQDQPAPAGPIAWRDVWRIEPSAAGSVLRFMRADPAAEAACVQCHNDTEPAPEVAALRVAAGVPPGKQWVQHQLLGAIEVSVPLNRVEAVAAAQMADTMRLVIAVSLLGLLAASWFAYHDTRKSQATAAAYEIQARYDALTGLPNRLLLKERTEEMIKRVSRESTYGALIFLDLDDFKNINDSLGHSAGDTVLRVTAQRLATCVRQTDTVGRYSGDEFVIVVDGIGQPADAAEIARKIMTSVTEPHSLSEHDVIVSASIGIACFPNDGTDAGTLLKNADAAMYRSKENGRNQVSFFSSDMNAKALYKLGMTAKLRQAIARGELELFYQPKLSLHDKRVACVEALVRWRHPEFGLLTPDKFVHLAEESGLIEPLGEWALREALEQLARWRKKGLPVLQVAVNVSARQFNRPNFVQRLKDILAEAQAAPDCLEIEITESAVIRDPDKVEQVIAAIHAHGVSIAIDDFGVGHSSLNYLKRFRISTLKIDKSFVDGIPHDEHDRAISDAIIVLGKALKLKVVAEGVENEAQRDYLARAGCDEMQGFLFAKPLPAAEAEAFLTTRFEDTVRMRPPAGR